MNRSSMEDTGHVFEGIAQNRMQILQDWAEAYWEHMRKLQSQLLEGIVGPEVLADLDSARWTEACAAVLKRGRDFSELFVVDRQMRVVCSTYPKQDGRVIAASDALYPGLQAVRTGEPCLFGPYADPLTEAIGPSTSEFHDAMTMMFILPVASEGGWAGALCGRVPNDVLGDLIQRESGHVYPDSGDNYVFMARPGLNLHIAPGTALSRSRFEDVTFTHGDNLKDGVRTDYGTVRVKHHTELELVFKDPATGELHPGVRNTIANGENLFVGFPGYPDYRHVPVIGKGVTFRMPHCPDVWGMMCEGDLEEVYRTRSIGWKLKRMHLAALAAGTVLNVLLFGFLSRGLPLWIGILSVLLGNLLLGAAAVNRLERKGTRPAAAHLLHLNRFIRINAEGKGDLTQRLDLAPFADDEVKTIGRWVNNMIDSLEAIMLQVKQAAEDVQSSQRVQDEGARTTGGSAERVGNSIHLMMQGLRTQLKDIDVAKEVSAEMSSTLRELEEAASRQIAVAQSEVMQIGEKMMEIEAKIGQSHETIRAFMDTTRSVGSLLQSIENISNQTNLLSLNASIEAAHAGEHGLGFAVVAGEIRKLAELTRQSALQIQSTLQLIGGQVEASFQSMNEGSQVIAEGTEMVATAAAMLGQAGANETLKQQMAVEVATLMEKVAAVSVENRQISLDVESTLRELQEDIGRVRSASGHAESITGSLLKRVNQFRLTER
ncbi:methyl-accepting chemotaxis protein [Paenibacillus sp. SAF-054]|uniref:methyl-accepting chemotaxis protein n=1 Tax=unclassified Paenibacillus TaxID=185978 RepID=UPI003F7FD8AB